MNEHLYDENDLIVTGMNGETIGELNEGCRTYGAGNRSDSKERGRNQDRRDRVKPRRFSVNGRMSIGSR